MVPYLSRPSDEKCPSDIKLGTDHHESDQWRVEAFVVGGNKSSRAGGRTLLVNPLQQFPTNVCSFCANPAQDEEIKTCDLVCVSAPNDLS